jgi:outer membrane protein OmpA-like peptidoglycan-associated protein
MNMRVGITLFVSSLAGVTFATASDGASGLDAVDQAASVYGEVRTITGEVRQIVGMGRVVNGKVLSLEGLARGLREGGLQVVESKGRVEVMLPSDILFDFDKAIVRPTAAPTLEKVARAAKSSGERTIRIEGHTDSIGLPAYNARLSKMRADAVSARLVQNGVTAARLSAEGFGATRPVAPNRTPSGADDPVGRQKNRRVTITFRE